MQRSTQRSTRYDRAGVVEQALSVLDRYGLPDLTMRRLGAELGVQPSALYHHFPNKQTLLAAVADELLARGPHRTRSGAWADDAHAVCADLRDAVLAYRDGAEVVATVRAFGLGAAGPERELTEALAAFGDGLARVAARTLVHFVLGHTVDEQTHLQADSAGALPPTGLDGGRDDFDLGVALVLDGLRARVGTTRPG